MNAHPTLNNFSTQKVFFGVFAFWYYLEEICETPIKFDTLSKSIGTKLAKYHQHLRGKFAEF